MRCDGTLMRGQRELPPEDGWRVFEPTDHLMFSCNHGLSISGPREQVRPLVEAHCGLPSQGRNQTVFTPV